jgi:hypothetical protein
MPAVKLATPRPPATNAVVANRTIRRVTLSRLVVMIVLFLW